MTSPKGTAFSIVERILARDLSRYGEAQYHNVETGRIWSAWRLDTSVYALCEQVVCGCASQVPREEFLSIIDSINDDPNSTRKTVDCAGLCESEIVRDYETPIEFSPIFPSVAELTAAIRTCLETSSRLSGCWVLDSDDTSDLGDLLRETEEEEQKLMMLESRLVQLTTGMGPLKGAIGMHSRITVDEEARITRFLASGDEDDWLRCSNTVVDGDRFIWQILDLYCGTDSCLDSHSASTSRMVPSPERVVFCIRRAIDEKKIAMLDQASLSVRKLSALRVKIEQLKQRNSHEHERQADPN